MLSRAEVLAVTLAIAVALLMTLVAVIASVGAEPQQATQGGPPDPACVEWTDSCVVCARTAEGFACSMPGIACTRGVPRCLRR